MSQHRSYVTAHVLDAATGTPARGVSITLSSVSDQETGERKDSAGVIAEAVTDDDGRVSELGPAHLPSGVYQITFGTGDYFAARGQDTFYPQVQVQFRVEEAQAHYHVPLLLSPFAYSTYRGS